MDCREGLADCIARWARHAGGADSEVDNSEGDGAWVWGQVCQGW